MELSLPAGSLESAIASFKGGADSVYLGMKDFSARKRAQNFSFEDLSKLKSYAVEHDKKIYVTINTVIYEEEMNELALLLRQLEFLKIDGLIVQDIGAASFISRNFPSLDLHGSTQMAIHTAGGVKFLQRMGFKRVVLSRELSFEKIEAIRKECPDIELKVFIHGAMCYGFSGLCEASRLITGRSANRGECAQICRTWFSCQQANRNGCFFAMKDLEIGEEIGKLIQIGIDSVKIEGRMKGPAYCYSTAHYYRLLIDGCSDTNELENARTAMETSFLRDHSDGYFQNRNDLICPDYCQHMGIKAGKVEKLSGTRMSIHLSHPVAIRDGLLLINSDIRKESCRFALMDIEDENGRRRSFANAGESFTTPIPPNSNPQEGQDLFLISLHNSSMEALKVNAMPHYKSPVNTFIFVLHDRLRIEATICKKHISHDYKVEIQKASNDTDFSSILKKVFSSSADSLFTLGTVNCDLSHSGFDKVFIPISMLKEIRRSWYVALDEEAIAYLNPASDEKSLIKPFCSPDSSHSFIKLPQRKLLGLWGEILKIDGASYLPLSPIMEDETAFFADLETEIANNPGLIVGLNNIAQVEWAISHPDAKVFADIYLYLANPVTACVLVELLPSLVGGYFFMEGDASGRSFSNWPFVPTDASDFVPPLFVSMAGFPIDGEQSTVTQNGRKYMAKKQQGLTIVTQQ